MKVQKKKGRWDVPTPMDRNFPEWDARSSGNPVVRRAFAQGYSFGFFGAFYDWVVTNHPERALALERAIERNELDKVDELGEELQDLIEAHVSSGGSGGVQ